MRDSTEPQNVEPKIDTGGGALVEGGVDTQGGDFIGRDKIINILANIPRWLLWTLAAGIVLIASTLIVGTGLLGVITTTISATPTATATPTVTPTPVLIKMDAAYNIVVAQFEEVDAQGAPLADNTVGQWLSEWLAGQLNTAMPKSDSLLVWHDKVNRPSTNPPIGVLNATSAEALLDEKKNIGANFVIYGQLVHGNGVPVLQLGFAYRAKSVSSQPDATIGFHRLGSAVRIIGLEEGGYRERMYDNPELAIRAQLLVWLVRGLSRDLEGNYARAFEIFKEAEKVVKEWEDSHQAILNGGTLAGMEVIFYFQGREALALQRFGEAFEAFAKALALNKTYASALLGRGNVYLDGVQFYLLSQQGGAGDVAACAPNLSLSTVIDQAYVPHNDAEALAQIDEARKSYIAAKQAVSTTDWSLLSPVVQSMIARTDLSLAEFGLQVTEPEQRRNLIWERLTEADQGFQTILPEFEKAGKLDYLAFIRYNLGLVYLAQASLTATYENQASAEPYYQRARELFRACHVEPSILAEAGYEPMEKQIGCYCQYWENQVLDVIGGSG